jgi:DNA modification methylase
MPARHTSRIARPLRDLAVPITDLSSDPANLRLHDERSLEAIAASLRRFGQQKPVVYDANGTVVAGNGMLEAARRLGWKTIAAIRSELVGVDRVAYAIADNRTAELSRWDDEALRATLAAMPADAVRDAGYTPEELEALLAPSDDVPLREEPVPAVLADAVTVVGDLWTLGDHRVLCGDSTAAADVDRLMDGRKASLIATDPPYLVDYTGVRAGSRGKDWSGAYREIDIQDAAGFFRSVFSNVTRVAGPHAAIYCWHAHKRMVEIMAAWRALGILDHQQIVWVKPAPVFGSVFWHFRHEPCLMGWLQGSKPTHDGRHDEDSVWPASGSARPLEDLTKEQLLTLLKDGSSVWEVDWEGKARPTGNEHPTQKPLELFARPIRKHTRRRDVCFEPFSGSGTQLLAAEQLGRRCYAMELEPVFVDVAIRRWQALTGKAARLGPDGPTWAEVAAERGVRIDGPAGENLPCPPSRPASAPTPDATPSRRRGTAQRTKPPTPSGRTGRARKAQRRRGATASTGGG